MLVAEHVGLTRFKAGSKCAKLMNNVIVRHGAILKQNSKV
jgi:hypothetical protein